MLANFPPQIRNSDGVYAVYDFIRYVCEYSESGARRLWDNKIVKEHGSNSNLFISAFKFSGNGQRLTPVTNRKGLLYLLTILPELAKKRFRVEQSKIIEECLDADSFELLLQENTRSDNYVNATELCKHFGKDLFRYKETERYQKLIAIISTKYNLAKNEVVESYSSSTSSDLSAEPTTQKVHPGTYIHTLLAIDLAEWLNPKFALFVKETFKAFIDADVKLAESIVERTADLEGLERLTTKAKGRQAQLKAYYGLQHQLNVAGAESVHYACVHGYNNQLAGIGKTRTNGINYRQAKYLTILETMEELALASAQTKNPSQAVKICRVTGDKGRAFLEEQGLSEASFRPKLKAR